MLIINLPFLTKKDLLNILKKLSEKQYIQTQQIKTKNIYTIKYQDLINNTLQNSPNIISNQIINIKDLNYIVTALFYGVRDNHDSQIQIIYLIVLCHLFQLPTIVFCKGNGIKTICDKKNMIKKFIKKHWFITQFINNITMTFNTTSQQIHIEYNKHLQTYRQLYKIKRNKH